MLSEKDGHINGAGRRVVAFVIGIENYQRRSNSISDVDYAKADAGAFADMLKEMHAPQDLELSIFLNEQATKSALEYELKLAVESLEPDDLFVFYYAGHGFYGAGGNRLTAYDTYKENLSETTLLLRDVLTDKLDQSDCRSSLLFIDACAARFDAGLFSREAISSLNEAEFSALTESQPYSAIYLSCAPGQKSYSSSELKHGIWTHFLLNALQGDEAAFAEGRNLTDVSLRDYLFREVPRFITKRTNIRGNQQPHAIISASTGFVIRHFPKQIRPVRASNDLASITGKVSDEYLEAISTGSVKRLKGFARHHRPPSAHTASTKKFVSGLLEDQVAEDLQNAYEVAKKLFRLKKADTQQSIVGSVASLDSPPFRFEIVGEQDPDDPAGYRIVKKLRIRQYSKDLAGAFDSSFGLFDAAVIEFTSKDLDFNDVVARFEELAEDNEGDVTDDEPDGTVTYRTTEGDTVIVDTVNQRITFEAPRRTLPSAILTRVQNFRLGLQGSQFLILTR